MASFALKGFFWFVQEMNGKQHAAKQINILLMNLMILCQHGI